MSAEAALTAIVQQGLAAGMLQRQAPASPDAIAAGRQRGALLTASVQAAVAAAGPHGVARPLRLAVSECHGAVSCLVEAGDLPSVSAVLRSCAIRRLPCPPCLRA